MKTKLLSLLLLLLVTSAIMAQIDTIKINNKLFEVGHLVNNKKAGRWTVYGYNQNRHFRTYSDSLCLIETFMKNMQPIESYFIIETDSGDVKQDRYMNYENGKLIEVGFYNKGEPIGVWTTYDLLGSIIVIDRFSNKDEMVYHQSLFPSGHIKECGYFIPDIGRIGFWKQFYPNGKIRSCGNYVRGFIKIKYKPTPDVFASKYIFKKDSVWMYWNNYGKLDSTVLYRNGIRLQKE